MRSIEPRLMSGLVPVSAESVGAVSAGEASTGAASAGALFDRGAHNPSFRSVVAERQGSEPIDFCVPVNPYYPPPALLTELRERLESILMHYPDEALVHQQALAPLAGVAEAEIVVANGSTELITSLCRDLRGPLVTPVPTFGRWTDLPIDFGQRLVPVLRPRDDGYRLAPDAIVAAARDSGARAVAFCNPENPSGAVLDDDEVAWLIRQLADLDRVIIDESFIDFSDLKGSTRAVLASRNAVMVKSLGKSLGWHGLRLGYAVASRPLADALRSRLPYWNINGVAAYVLDWTARHLDALRDSFAYVKADRTRMASRLASVPGITVQPSQANFLHVRLARRGLGRRLRNRLLEAHGLYVRECSNKIGASENELRLAVLPPPAQDRLVAALQVELPALGGSL